ncbi:MAG: hypothetical protein JWN44_6863 [Myxococcales bacterium]|nr:hypothetical protein [Myxococcales bacterium]
MKRIWLVVMLAGCGGVSEIEIDSAARAITALESAPQNHDVGSSNPMPGQPGPDPAAASPTSAAASSAGGSSAGDPASSNPMPGFVAAPSPVAAAFVNQTR